MLYTFCKFKFLKKSYQTFLLPGFSFIGTSDSQYSRGRQHPWPSLPLPHAQKHSDIYLQFVVNLFFRLVIFKACHIITRLSLHEIYMFSGIKIWLNVTYIFLHYFTLDLEAYFRNLFWVAAAFISFPLETFCALFTWYCRASVNMTSMDLVGAELLLYFRNILFHFWMATGWFFFFFFFIRKT